MRERSTRGDRYGTGRACSRPVLSLSSAAARSARSSTAAAPASSTRAAASARSSLSASASPRASRSASASPRLSWARRKRSTPAAASASFRCSLYSS